MPTSRLVANITGMQVQRNKAIVGRNAFAHEAGIHQDGMLKERSTYEIMRPEDVGFAKTDLVLGKHSGRAALADRAKALGYHLTGEQLQSVFEEFKILADKKKEIYDADIAALIDQRIHDVSELWSIVSYQLAAGPAGRPSVTLTLRHGSEEVSEQMARSLSGGPVGFILFLTSSGRPFSGGGITNARPEASSSREQRVRIKNSAAALMPPAAMSAGSGVSKPDIAQTRAIYFSRSPGETVSA